MNTVQPADLGSEFTQLQLATGTTVAGKTQMSKYGFSVLAEHPRLGPARNPWKPTTPRARRRGAPAPLSPPARCLSRTPTTAGGTIRIPASCNGFVGFSGSP
jgi:amidase